MSERSIIFYDKTFTNNPSCLVIEVISWKVTQIYIESESSILFVFITFNRTTINNPIHTIFIFNPNFHIHENIPSMLTINAYRPIDYN